MFRPLEEKPIHPRNGDKWKQADGSMKIFNFGRWIGFKEIE